MLDGVVRKRLDPVLDRIGSGLARAGVGANTVTVVGLVVGLVAAVLIATGHLWAGLVVLLASRLCDGLDGAVARVNGKTDLGGYLDIVLDFVFYGAIPFAFVVLDPARNGLCGALLILSFYVNGASFLAYAVMAEKRQLTTEARGRKSLYFTTGLAEATETIGIFVTFCLFPSWFPHLAAVFAVICFYTALSRIMLAAQSFGD